MSVPREDRAEQHPLKNKTGPSVHTPSSGRRSAYLHQVRLIQFLAMVNELLPWYTGWTLLGLSLKRVDGAWRLVVNLDDRSGRSVAFYHADDPWACLYNFALDVKHDSIKAYPDKFLS